MESMPKRPEGNNCRSSSGTSNSLAVREVCVCVEANCEHAKKTVPPLAHKSYSLYVCVCTCVFARTHLTHTYTHVCIIYCLTEFQRTFYRRPLFIRLVGRRRRRLVLKIISVAYSAPRGARSPRNPSPPSLRCRHNERTALARRRRRWGGSTGAMMDRR